MNVCDNTDEIDMSKNMHKLKLSGLLIGTETIPLLIICLIGFDKD